MTKRTSDQPHMPTVSVMIPTHSRVQYLKEAIESVLAQTYQDWELVVIGDGCSDSTRTVMEDYANRDSRIRVAYQAHEGLANARNHAIKLSRGAYIAFLDDDDVWLPTKLEKQIAYVGAHPEKGLVFTLTYVVDAKLRGSHINPRDWGCSFETLLEHDYIPILTVLARRECIVAAGLFDEGLEMSCDYDLWLRIAKITELGCLEEPLAMYRRHGTNMSMDNPSVTFREHISIYQKWLASNELLPRQTLKRRVAQEYYSLARAYREENSYFVAAACFARSVITWPWIGLQLPGGHESGSSRVRLLPKPYLAIAYCLLRGIAAGNLHLAARGGEQL